MNLPDLDLDLLRCFLAVAESGGFTSAARRLNLSQSAVSLKIQRLESLLGRLLFTRTSRSLKLTPEGEILLDYARRLLALNQEMIQRVSQPAVGGMLRLGVIQQFGQEFLPQLLSQFKKAHPGVRLCVEVGMSADLLLAMEEGRFDIVLAAAGFLPGPGSQGGAFAEERVIMREPLVWVQARNSTLNLRQDPLPLVLFTSPCAFRRAAGEALEKAGRAWESVYSSASLASIQAAVQADLGISVFARSSVQPGMKILGPRQGLPALPDSVIALYRRKSAAEPLTSTLAGFITQSVARWQEQPARQPAVATA